MKKQSTQQPAAAKTYRCSLFSPEKGQCVLKMYHVETEHRFDPSSPWSQTLEELQAWYAKREEQESGARDPRNERSDDHDDDSSPDDEYSGDNDLAIGEKEEVNWR